MNQDSRSLDQELLSLLQAVREAKNESARESLNARLRADPNARAAMARLLVDEQALVTRLRDDSIVSLLKPSPVGASKKVGHFKHWLTARPLTAAAAGLAFGMICTSMVLGYVADRAAVKKTPLTVFDAGLEGIKPLDTGLPHNVERWGVRAAQIVTAEKGVQPLQGHHMLRLEPSLLGKQDKNLYAHAYQILDLRSLPSQLRSESREVLVSASFSADNSTTKVRNYIRIYALNEPPGVASVDFWSKAEGDEGVSLMQRFEIEPSDAGWRPFSAKMPLPHGAQSLVIIFSSTTPKDEPLPPLSYVDDVQVSLLTTPNNELP
jgi:hypothetical protein